MSNSGNDSAETPPEKSVSFLGRIRSGLRKTRTQLAEGVGNLLLGEKEIGPEVLDDLEMALLSTDVGVATTQGIIAELAEKVRRSQLADTRALHSALSELLKQKLIALEGQLSVSPPGPRVIFFVGVNGVGKTTTIGKLAKKFQREGYSVMLAAGDTFRAAAVEQLQVWGDRNDVPVVAQAQGSDSASVVYDAVASARSKGVDVLLVDTAGRLQAKAQLMDELAKIHRVVKRLDADAPHEVILVLDAGVGQNALSQVQLFGEAVPLTGLVLTKLDGSAKAGVVFAIAESGLENAAKNSDEDAASGSLPVYFIGVGESEDDLRPFNAEDFVDALLAEETTVAE